MEDGALPGQASEVHVNTVPRTPKTTGRGGVLTVIFIRPLGVGAEAWGAEPRTDIVHVGEVHVGEIVTSPTGSSSRTT